MSPTKTAALALISVALTSLALTGAAFAAEHTAPAGQRYATITARGTILPGGRVLQPLGTQLETGPGPFGLAIGPKGLVATANIGFERLGVTVITPTKDPKDPKGPWDVRQLFTRTPNMKTPEEADPEWKGVFYGIAFDGEKSAWVSEGETGRVRLFDTTTGAKRKTVALDDATWHHSFSADLAFDPARHRLYVVDQANFRVAVIDTAKGTVLASAKVGRMPYAIALSPDGTTAYVTNAGMFQYQVLPNADRKDSKRSGLPFPAFGFPSAESRDGARRQTEAGPVDVPGLGDPNVKESNSVCVIDLKDPEKPAVLDWVRTGTPFDSKTFGGSAPAGVLAVNGHVYVSNAHDDTISIISAATRKLTAEIPLRIPGLESLRGVMPAGLAYDPLTKWLLVAEAGINAVGVVDTATNKLIGHLPVGWLPTRVAIDGDRVFVTNAHGRGTGPNLRRPLMEMGEHPTLHKGTVSTFILPAPADLPKLTATVFGNAGLDIRAVATPAPPAAIKHVVFIVKENRTFDEVFGDITQAANGSLAALPTMARFGMKGWTEAVKNTFAIKDAAITPNHHGIAKRWAMGDNFYADSDVSTDGHHWLVGAYPDPLTESGLLAAYGGQRNFVLDGNSPGRLLFAGSDSSVHPDEQPEAGTLWYHLERNKVSFRNFGEGFELAGIVEDKDEEPTGARFLTNVPMPDPLYRNTSRDYPGFNMNIPDQFRADHFIAEIEAKYRKPGQPLPQFIFIHLPNDHMTGEHPADGYPYRASYVEDNDLALGRIMEYLSHSPWWKEMTVFVTEDDAQGGQDHIDAHRTVLMAAGPYVKKNYVTHTNSSFPGLLKTVFEILGIPPLNLMDATASSLRDVFTATPDFAPWTALTPDQRIFDATKVKTGTAPPVKMDQPGN